MKLSRSIVSGGMYSNLWKISVLGPVVLQPEISHAHAPIRRVHALILWVCAVLEYSLASLASWWSHRFLLFSR